jgi:uncharacterized protein DUF4439
MSPVESLQHALAGEHAAVYLYGVLGGRVPASQQPDLAARLAAGYATHRGRRDQLTAMVRAAGGVPVAAEVSYRLPNPCRTPGQLRAAALEVERRCAAVYAATVAGTARRERAWAAEALADGAVRQLSFGGAPQPYPGMPGRPGPIGPTGPNG